MVNVLSGAGDTEYDAGSCEAPRRAARPLTIEAPRRFPRKARSPEARPRTQGRDGEGYLAPRGEGGPDESAGNSGKILVFCRVRPLNRAELGMGGKVCLRYALNRKQVFLRGERPCPTQANGDKKNAFRFNHVFDENSTQQDVFDVAARPILDQVLKGYNGTIFAYGQTASGKTYTMQGVDLYDVQTRDSQIPQRARKATN